MDFSFCAKHSSKSFHGDWNITFCSFLHPNRSFLSIIKQRYTQYIYIYLNQCSMITVILKIIFSVYISMNVVLVYLNIIFSILMRSCRVPYLKCSNLEWQILSILARWVSWMLYINLLLNFIFRAALFVYNIMRGCHNQPYRTV